MRKSQPKENEFVSLRNSISVFLGFGECFSNRNHLFAGSTDVQQRFLRSNVQTLTISVELAVTNWKLHIGTLIEKISPVLTTDVSFKIENSKCKYIFCNLCSVRNANQQENPESDGMSF